MTVPTISAVLRVYNGEQYIGETLRTILSQTRPADEVIVVDDGSTDGTADELRKFRGEIRVVAQANQGHTAALNRAFTEARGHYVANCDADDLWERTKLERQAEAVSTRPEVDIAFVRARSFGLLERDWLPLPADGVLDNSRFARVIYRSNFICASSTLIRRRLYERIGPFAEAMCCEDYDYWLRALAASAVFYYDPHVLVHHREHELGATRNQLKIWRGTHLVHCWHADVAPDRRVVRNVLADDLNRIARLLVETGETRAAQEAFGASLRRKPTGFALAWLLLLCTPELCQTPMIARSISIRRWFVRRMTHGLRACELS